MGGGSHSSKRKKKHSQVSVSLFAFVKLLELDTQSLFLARSLLFVGILVNSLKTNVWIGDYFKTAICDWLF